MSDEAWQKVCEDEAQALATLLATEGRRVIVIVCSSDEDGNNGSVSHGVAGEIHGRHLYTFISGVQRKLAWLISKTVVPR